MNIFLVEPRRLAARNIMQRHDLSRLVNFAFNLITIYHVLNNMSGINLFLRKNSFSEFGIWMVNAWAGRFYIPIFAKNRAKTGMLWGILSGPHIPGYQRVAYIGFATGGKMAVKPEFVRKKIVYLPPILT